jgi:hypothetical protein
LAQIRSSSEDQKPDDHLQQNRKQPFRCSKRDDGENDREDYGQKERKWPAGTLSDGEEHETDAEAKHNTD